jgi:hypothetical protein
MLIGAKWKNERVESPESKEVMELYKQGLLMVTTVQRKDLPKMHMQSERKAVSEHIKNSEMGGHQITVKEGDLKEHGALEHAKVNWTLTSPKMWPHYFGMVDRERSDRREPLAEPSIPNLVQAPRIATLADPRKMGPRFMRGKSGRDDFSDWEADQSSGKMARVKDGEQLFEYVGPVEQKIKKIVTNQEEKKLQINPEINTFGFPPEAVVGFLVTGNVPDNDRCLVEAKAKMGDEQAARTFPVFTWEVASRDKFEWRLVYIKDV